MRAATVAALLLAAGAAPAGAMTQAWSGDRTVDRITGRVTSVWTARAESGGGAAFLLIACEPGGRWAISINPGVAAGAPGAAVPVRWRVDPGAAVGDDRWTVSRAGDFAFVEGGRATALVGRLARGRTAVVEAPRAGRPNLQPEFDLRGLGAALGPHQEMGCEIPPP